MRAGVLIENHTLAGPQRVVVHRDHLAELITDLVAVETGVRITMPLVPLLREIVDILRDPRDSDASELVARARQALDKAGV